MFDEQAKSSLLQQTNVILVDNFFRHQLFHCKAVCFQVPCAPLSPKIKGRPSFLLSPGAENPSHASDDVRCSASSLGTQRDELSRRRSVVPTDTQLCRVQSLEIRRNSSAARYGFTHLDRAVNIIYWSTRLVCCWRRHRPIAACPCVCLSASISPELKNSYTSGIFWQYFPNWEFLTEILNAYGIVCSRVRKNTKFYLIISI